MSLIERKQLQCFSSLIYINWRIHYWRVIIIVTKMERVFDETIMLADNAMLRKRPELFYEWDFEKNDVLGLDVYKITHGSGKRDFCGGFKWMYKEDYEKAYGAT